MLTIFMGLLPFSKTHAESVTPFAADAFVDSVGVVMHLGYTDTAYAQNWETADKSQNVRELLGGLGVRHVRDGIPHPTLEKSRAYVRSRTAQLFRDYGIRFILGPNARKNNILDASQITPYIDDYANGVIDLDNEKFQVRDLVEAIEGPNEYDNHNHQALRDPNWVRNLKNYQSALYRSIKSNPMLARLPVVMPSLIYTKYCSDDLGSLEGTIDTGNLHPYPNYPYFLIPTGSLSWHLNHGKDCFGEKPVYVTEIGYQSSEKGISDKTIAKYMSVLLPEFFRQPQIKRTYVYSLIDTLPESNRWGLIRPERNGQKINGLDQFTLTPKPAYYAMQSLLNLLKEGKWAEADKQWISPTVDLKPVDITFEGKQNSTHHLLLQKSTDDYFLLIWQEIEAFNPTKGNFNPANDQVNVLLPSGYKLKTLYEYDDSFKFKTRSLTEVGNKLTLQVPDKVTVIHFTPQ
ncbi:MAG: hypothetical protein HC772_00945 [Leptolyngbyaceae cyanobacterium CRU_2_3]|nr:hypothetical protein [Leptolyngbyaceae cyanobacterium CRU_2_3]